ncbi:hypothetical protein SLA2020_308200 [Shorea laevis]
MILGSNSTPETHYDILSVKEDASYDEIRVSYRSAILNCHPDKQLSENESGDSFLKVQKAWEILGNPKSRAVYDSELQASRQDSVAAEDVSLEEMMAEDGGEVLELFYSCRCGDYFSVDSPELDKMGYKLLRDGTRISLRTPDALPASVILPCGSCSQHVRLLINPDIKVPLDDHI